MCRGDGRILITCCVWYYSRKKPCLFAMIVLPTDSATRLLPGSMNGDDVVVVESNKETKQTHDGGR
jgi:hypothetical protein